MTGGTIRAGLFFLGADGNASPQPITEATGEFLPVPGKAPDPIPSEPTIGDFSNGVGVYEMLLDFATAGAYGLAVEATLADDTTRLSTTRFQVAAEPQVPAVGDPAPPIDNLTVESVDVPQVAIDSRASGDNDIPHSRAARHHDRRLHGAGRPTLAVFSTPVYCVSQFCGPVTEMVGELAGAHDGRAEFVHVEIWPDFNAEQLNGAAATWLQTPAGLTEPWVFLIGADGSVQARWDNVADRAEIEQRLQELPIPPEGGR